MVFRRAGFSPALSLLMSAFALLIPPACLTAHLHRLTERSPTQQRISVAALRRFTSEFGMGSGGTTALRPPGKFCFIRPLLRSDLICIRLKIFSHPPKQLRRCKVKPHGSLVPVSSTHRCAYTPGLSTSSSSTFLQDSQGVRENSSRGKFRA